MTTSTSLVDRVRDTIRRHGMLRGGDVVLVAVSGGADSVALLDVLHALAGPLGLTLAAAHVHHGLHPDADAWAAGVRLRCDRLGVPCHVEQVAVKRGPPWEGLEAEARRARHDALARIARATGAARIATGHTAEDQAETVLMRLLQGAGPRGLGGIAPVRGILIRPLIESRRAEIEAHLRARGLTWVEDPSNRDPAMLRNRIRHDLLPFMAELTGGAVVEALGRSAAAARAMVADLESRARADLARLGRRDGAGVILDVGALRERPVELGAEVLRQAAALQGETRPLRGPAQRALRRVLAETPRRHAARLGRLVVERSGGALRVGPVTVPAVSSRPWPVPGVLELPEIGARLRARVLPRAAGYTVPRDAARAAFDADALPRVLRVRPRRAGDVFAPFGGPGVRRLKSFLIDAGVPRWARPRVPLVEAGSEIVWVAGVRRAALAPVTDTTVRILELALEALP